MTNLRARWAAIGAAVAVTLGGGGLATVSATSPSEAVTFVPISPCRLFDTRPDAQVGPRSTPLAPGETMTVKATGDNGNCSGIPAEATGVSMNLTADRQTELTFLTVWPSGATRPDASSLNPSPGDPVPNAVTTQLSAGGEFSVYNEKGSVHVLADVNGYYLDHHHDDRYYSKAEVDGRSPRQKVIVVGAAELVGRSPGMSMQLAAADGGGFQVGGPNAGFVASVSLPDGATITGVTATVYDSNGAQSLSAGLECENNVGFGSVFQKSPVALVTTGYQTFDLDPDTVSPVVDNEACVYRVYVYSGQWVVASSTLRFKAMRITVEMPS